MLAGSEEVDERIVCYLCKNVTVCLYVFCPFFQFDVEYAIGRDIPHEMLYDIIGTLRTW